MLRKEKNSENKQSMKENRETITERKRATTAKTKASRTVEKQSKLYREEANKKGPDRRNTKWRNLEKGLRSYIQRMAKINKEK